MLFVNQALFYVIRIYYLFSRDNEMVIQLLNNYYSKQSNIAHSVSTTISSVVVVDVTSVKQ